MLLNFYDFLCNKILPIKKVDKLLPKVWITRDSGRTSFGGVDHHGHVGRHGIGHYQRLHTPDKLLQRRLHPFPGSSNDDDGHPNTGCLQCTPLSVVLKRDRYERHPIGECGSGSKFGILNWDLPTKLPGNVNASSPDVSLASASFITSTNWQTKTNQGSDHLSILISLQMDHTINSIPHCTSFNLKKANWHRYRREINWAKDGFHQTAKK